MVYYTLSSEVKYIYSNLDEKNKLNEKFKVILPFNRGNVKCDILERIEHDIVHVRIYCDNETFNGWVIDIGNTFKLLNFKELFDGRFNLVATVT